jgi:hypothetical protein
MALQRVYEISKREGGWAVTCDGVLLFTFINRERALRMADLLAKRHFLTNSTSSVVRMLQGDAVDDIILYGEKDPAANALAWIRYVTMMRKNRKRGHEPAQAPETSTPDSSDQDVRRSA